MAVMILVMTIFIVVLFFNANSQADSVQAAITQKHGLDETVAALVSTMLVSTATPTLVPGGAETDIENPDTEEQIGSTDTSTIGKIPTSTNLPTSLSPTPSDVIPPVTRTPNPWVKSTLKTMTLSQKVGQMILTGINGTVLSSETCQFVQRISPGGIVYLSSNISSPYPDQLALLSGGLQNCVSNTDGVPLFISIDHEGTYVNRFPYESPMTVFPPAMAYGATGNLDLTYQGAFAAGQELSANGINMVLGPVADVLTNYDNTVISQRSYGGDPTVVSDLVGHVVQGYLAAGVLPVLKHYPGHGGVSGDSHTLLPIDQADLSRVINTHLVPFKGGIESGAPSIMVSHVAFPEIDSQGFPASLSPPLYQLLVDELNFQGFTMSDSMGMGAIGNTGLSVENASVKAINAGLDMVMLISPGLAESVHAAIVDAVQGGVIASSRIDQAVSRILDIKYEYGLLSSPLQSASTPDWNQNADIAYQVGYQSVSLHKDHAGLVPLTADIQKVLVVGPTDGWGLYPLLRAAFDERGIGYNILTYSDYWFGPIPETSYLQIVPARAPEYDLVLVFTWDSHPNRFLFGDTFQGQLVNILLQGGHKLIVIALKSPTDILDFPNTPTYLSSMGTTRGQLHGIIDILLGETQPVGQIPLPGLP